MAVKNGTNVVVKIGSTLVNAVLTNSYDLGIDMIDVTTKDSAGNKEYIAGESDVTAQLEGNYDPDATYSFEQLHTAALAKTAVTVLYGLNESGATAYQFSALISNVTLTGNKNEAGGWTASIQRTGGTTEVLFS